MYTYKYIYNSGQPCKHGTLLQGQSKVTTFRYISLQGANKWESDCSMGQTKGHGNLLQEASKWESVSFYYMGQTKGHGTLLQEAHQWAFVLWGKQKVMAICCRRQTNGAAFCCTKQKQKRYGSLLQGTHKGPYGLRINRDGLNRTYAVYTRYFWQRNHETYGHIRCIYTVLANPTHEIGTACCSSPALCLTMKEYSSPLSLFSINYYDRISNERSTTTQKCSDRG